MAHKYTSHTSGLFLLELILAILFFSIASAICVQLFVKSHLLSRKAENLSIAVNECSDAAEIILSSDNQTELFERFDLAYPNAIWSDYENNEFQIEIFYHDDSKMTISCSISYLPSENSEIAAKILYVKQDINEPVYELEINHLLSETQLTEEINEP